MDNQAPRRHVIAQLHWLTQEPLLQSSRLYLTGFREKLGMEDLFSVVIEFSNPDTGTTLRGRVKIFALAEAMEYRLPSMGEKLIITAGPKPVALAEIISKAP